MRKIKLKTIMAGPGGCFDPGQIISVEDDLAYSLIAGGYAEYVDQAEQKYETAAIEPQEKAVLPRKKHGKFKK
jgi:hypothetical protein